MNPSEYDMYRNLGWTAEETWQFLSETSATNDGVIDDEEV